jgi:hypothetical protein
MTAPHYHAVLAGQYHLEVVKCGLEEELPVANEAAEAVLPECPASHS